MEPDDFRAYVSGIRAIEASIGDGVKLPRPEERSTAEVARRSIVALRDLASGSIIGDGDVAIMRPGTGLPPSMLDVVVGTRVGRDVAAFSPLTLDDLHG
jgi:sialic acid synthase SpsE